MSPRAMTFLLALLASLLATAFANLEQGIYRISNVASTTTIRSYVNGAPIFVTNTKEEPGLNELWLVKRVPRSPDNFYTLENLGLSAFAALNEATGDLVATSPTEQAFLIQEVDNSGIYTVSRSGLQSVWTVEPPFDHAYVKVQNTATGTAGQQWRFASAII